MQSREERELWRQYLPLESRIWEEKQEELHWLNNMRVVVQQNLSTAFATSCFALLTGARQNNWTVAVQHCMPDLTLILQNGKKFLEKV